MAGMPAALPQNALLKNGWNDFCCGREALDENHASTVLPLDAGWLHYCTTSAFLLKLHQFSWQ